MRERVQTGIILLDVVIGYIIEQGLHVPGVGNSEREEVPVDAFNWSMALCTYAKNRSYNCKYPDLRQTCQISLNICTRLHVQVSCLLVARTD